MQVIDVKAHPISTDPAAYPPADHENWSRRPPSSWERLMALMDEAEIRKTVLIQSTSTYGYDNRYAAGGPKAYPDRFAWVGSVDALAPDGAERLAYWVREWGMAGLRITTTARPDDTAWIGDPATFPVYSKARDLGIPVAVLNVGEAGLLQLEGILQRFPGLTLILDHLISPPLSRDPRPELVETFLGLAKYPTVHVLLTGVEFTGENQAVLDRYLDRAIEAFGTERLLWGSNYPTSPGPTKKLLGEATDRLAFLPEPDRERIFYRNAHALYPALGKPGP